MVTFTLVPGGTTNRCLWMRLSYRLMLPTGTLGSSMSYFKRKISIFSSEVMCRRDGKKDTRETRDSVFETGTLALHQPVPMGTFLVVANTKQ